MHNHNLSNFLGSFVVAQQKHKSQITYLSSSQYIIENLKIIQKLGYIQGFTIFTNIDGQKSVTVYIRYKTGNTAGLTKVQIYSTPGRKLFLTQRKIEKLITKLGRTDLIFSTSYGLCFRRVFQVNNTIAFKHGGLLLYTLGY
jgi:ribosomal protein S8